MRLLTVFIAFASPAAAWEYSPVPVCTVSHRSDAGAITLTYDPSQADPYAIAITSPDDWASGKVFGLHFDGASALTITTDRQVVSGETLTVRDQGFGNVLNGLQFNTNVTAFAGDTSLAFSLDGAAPEIEKFRACLVTPIA